MPTTPRARTSSHEFDKIKIEDGIPVPPRRLQGVSVLLERLADPEVAVEASVLIPAKSNKSSNITSVAKQMYGHSRWLTTRTVRNEQNEVQGVRVWKTAEAPPKLKSKDGTSASA
jgi:hypothetical protein